jgi:hypothetical protein
VASIATGIMIPNLMTRWCPACSESVIVRRAGGRDVALGIVSVRISDSDLLSDGVRQ